MKGMKPEDVDLATALKLLSLPKKLGPHPSDGEPITAFNGVTSGNGHLTGKRAEVAAKAS